MDLENGRLSTHASATGRTPVILCLLKLLLMTEAYTIKPTSSKQEERRIFLSECTQFRTPNSLLNLFASFLSP